MARISRTVRVAHRVVWTFSGNNVSVASDLARRCIRIDLDANVEAPHLRDGFEIGNLLRYVSDEHPRLLTSALTILRGFAAAGCPQHGGPALGMFEGWDELIRSCVIWATGNDPVETQHQLRGESPESCALAALITAWQAAIGTGPVQAADLLRLPDVATAIAEAIPTPGDAGLPSAKSFGHYLRQNSGRVVGGFKIDRVGTKVGTALWAVKEVLE